MCHADERCSPGYMEQEQAEADERAYADYLSLKAYEDQCADDESLFADIPEMEITLEEIIEWELLEAQEAEERAQTSAKITLREVIAKLETLAAKADLRRVEIRALMARLATWPMAQKSGASRAAT